ncbi:MAG: quinolinate synthase NadA [Candidatus Altiarchaeota archaeon]|nr:quinolinate synthase NadA [Candidatus Altiarchaeota archaeon]
MNNVTNIRELSGEIDKLRRERNAVILAHNYQRPEVQDVADFVGDSLELARQAAKTDAEVIVFCGVYFMAETAKIVNPRKRVLIPDPLARCPMALMLSPEDILESRRSYPDSEVVLYVNSSSDCKALADCVCTSANAPQIVKAMDSDIVLFGPDRNLAYYAQKRTDKEVVVVPEGGNCPTHHQLSLVDVLRAKGRHPDAELVVHPEVNPGIQELADGIESTGGMLRYCRESSADEFIIGTEEGMLYRLKREFSDKRFYHLSPPMLCPPMKSLTLDKVLDSLRGGLFEVRVSERVLERAGKAIDRMLELSRN